MAGIRRRRPRLLRLRDWTLRARIVSGILALLVFLCVTIGLVTALSLKHFLMDRLDSQLTAQAGRQQGAFNRPFNGTPIPCGSSNGETVVPRGAEVNTIGVQVCPDGTAQGFILQQNSTIAVPESARLSSAAQAALLRVANDGRPHTVEVPGHGSYRALSRPSPDGDRFVTALPLGPVTSTLWRLTAVITGVTIAGLVVAGLLGALIVRLALSPLRRVTATASKVAEMPLDEGEVALAIRVPDPNPHTEVGQVGVALNRMLENVSDALNARHESETRVRQFVADASHELRTPLASIRGYAELTRRSRELAPPDIAHAMNRVESEADRMTTLVEDLLLLARLDAGRPLASDDVDLTRLTLDVLSDAHAAGGDHVWHLQLPDEPVVVRGDESRLHQVLVNLLANARTHTPPGTNVQISLSATGKDAVLEVRDDGPGIAPTLLPEIFERFSRGEGSRSRAAGSTGLGLAIVAAVITAHGGRIDVHSRAGETVFTVRLPMHGEPEARPQTSASSKRQFLQA